MKPRAAALLVMLASSLACTGGGGPDPLDTDTPVPDDSGSPAAAGSGLPEGESTWSGDIEVAGTTFPVELSLTNTGGDLHGELSFSIEGFGDGIYSVTGTHEPTAGLIAIAPEDWIEEPDIALELLGLLGTYDPDTQSITGTVADYASASDNTLTGGPAALALVSGGDGSPTTSGAGALGLPTGEARAFSGTMQCTGAQREVEGEMTYDGEGGISGTLTFGNTTLAEQAITFRYTGAHNPSTGGITLVPGLYEDTDHTFVSFFVEGAYDPSGDAFTGEVRQNVGSCPEGLWQVAF